MGGGFENQNKTHINSEYTSANSQGHLSYKIYIDILLIVDLFFNM